MGDKDLTDCWEIQSFMGALLHLPPQCRVHQTTTEAAAHPRSRKYCMGYYLHFLSFYGKTGFVIFEHHPSVPPLTKYLLSWGEKKQNAQNHRKNGNVIPQSDSKAYF